VRLVAIILEQSSLDQSEQVAILDQVDEEKHKDLEEEEKWFNTEKS
jgi:hypothetical protein